MHILYQYFIFDIIFYGNFYGNNNNERIMHVNKKFKDGTIGYIDIYIHMIRKNRYTFLNIRFYKIFYYLNTNYNLYTLTLII